MGTAVVLVKGLSKSTCQHQASAAELNPTIHCVVPIPSRRRHQTPTPPTAAASAEFSRARPRRSPIRKKNRQTYSNSYEDWDKLGSRRRFGHADRQHVHGRVVTVGLRRGCAGSGRSGFDGVVNSATGIGAGSQGDGVRVGRFLLERREGRVRGVGLREVGYSLQ